jgi:hypothetical protein
MKKSFKLILFIPLLLLFIQSSCKKDTPKITTYGPYQFAAKVNGQDFMPSGDYLNPPLDFQLLASNTSGKYDFYIMAFRNNESSIELYIDDFKGVGTYPLKLYTIGYPQVPHPPSCGMYRMNSSNHPLWVTNSIDTGSVTFTEYSGGKTKCYFFFKAKNLQDTTKVEVTNGYFSIN